MTCGKYSRQSQLNDLAIQMADYYFQGLSPYDFELLVRDLLQAKLQLQLEAFSAGHDKGIDLRYSQGPSNLIVQCKHYPHTDWSALKRSLSGEAPKVRQLNPTRYIVATSMGLTPERKTQIQRLFTPYCDVQSDVLGREDLNNLLSQHADIERNHHKLWLTSVPILSRVLNAQIFSERQAQLDMIQRRVSRFVVNPSINRALQALTDHKFVIITGVPGIGKTTLAEMLIIDHLRQGFECFSIWEGVKEARAVLQRSEPQLFYFDDFLGRTGLRHQLLPNEDERLVRFIREVSQSENTRLVMTTREYILNQARMFMEALGSAEIEIGRCVVNLGDYTPQIRAEILYNHLYFSEVPADHLEALLDQRTYRTIVRHPNYNPRILETMTDILHIRSFPPAEYPHRFLDALANPRKLWEVAFLEHLSTEAQNALLVIATLPDRVRLPDAERAFAGFHEARAGRYGFGRKPYDWERALKELEGNFLKHDLSHGEMLIGFHNPSIRDFLEGHLRQHKNDVDDLRDAAVFSSQVLRLWEVLSRSGRDNVIPSFSSPEMAARYWALRDSDSVTLQLVQYNFRRYKWLTVKDSLLSRFLGLWDIVKVAPAECRKILDTACHDVLAAIRHPVDRKELVGLLERFQASCIAGFGRDHELFNAALCEAFQFDQHIDISEFFALADFTEKFPELVTSETKDRLIASFRSAAEDEEQAIKQESDYEIRLSWFEELEAVASKLGVSLDLSRSDLEEDVEARNDVDGDSDWSRPHESFDGYVSDETLDSLFDSLKGFGV